MKNRQTWGKSLLAVALIELFVPRVVFADKVRGARGRIQQPRKLDKRADQFNIDLINFSDNPTEYDYLFYLAAQRWEEIIVADTIPGVQSFVNYDLFQGSFHTPFYGPLDDFVLGFQIVNDNTFGSNFFGSALVTAVYVPDLTRYTPPNYPAAGALILNSDALVRNGLSPTDILLIITKEIGHFLGVGSPPWFRFCANSDCLSNGVDGYYCARAQIAYKELDILPVLDGELLLVNLDGGPYRACNHWAEASFDVPGVTSELMTPFREEGIAQPISTVTVGALEDLGYIVDYKKADKFPKAATGKANSGKIPKKTRVRKLDNQRFLAVTEEMFWPLIPNTNFSTPDMSPPPPSGGANPETNGPIYFSISDLH